MWRWRRNPACPAPENDCARTYVTDGDSRRISLSIRFLATSSAVSNGRARVLSPMIRTDPQILPNQRASPTDPAASFAFGWQGSYQSVVRNDGNRRSTLPPLNRHSLLLPLLSAQLDGAPDGAWSNSRRSPDALSAGACRCCIAFVSPACGRRTIRLRNFEFLIPKPSRR